MSSTGHHISGKARNAQRLRLLQRDGPLCWICRAPMDLANPNTPAAPTIDHVIPVSQGGNDTDANSRLAHRSCNAARGNRPPTTIGPQSRSWL